jgi:hypothetical protein
MGLLPTEPQANPPLTPDRLRGVVFGRPGAGKSTLAAGWYPKNTLILDLEGSTRMLPGEHFVHRIGSYSEFMQVVNELLTTEHPFNSVVIDTVDNLIRLADSEAGQRYGKVAAGLADYGRGLADRDGTVLRDLRRLLSTDLGVILIAHPTIVQEQTEDGKTSERLYPRIDPNDRIRQEVMGLVDFVLYVRKDDHKIVTGGDNAIETKRRCELPDVLDSDARELAKAIQTGFKAVEKEK